MDLSGCQDVDLVLAMELTLQEFCKVTETTEEDIEQNAKQNIKM